MNIESPLSRTRVAGIAVLAPTLGLIGILASSCASPQESLIVLGGFIEDASVPPAFVAPTDAGEVDAPVTRPPVAMCATTACPAPFTTCAEVPQYACETNLSNDSNNCGSCGKSCAVRFPNTFHMGMTCVAGECRTLCGPGYLDCNGVPDDGCEVDPAVDPANCGGCGNQCAPGVRCVEGACGCPAGTVDCNGECKDVTSDDDNCGSCGYVCADHAVDAGTLPPHMVFGCFNAQCAEKCESTRTTYWANCNGVRGDGCEINLNGDTANCGQCGKQCAPGKQCYGTDKLAVDCRDPEEATQCPVGQTRCGSWCVSLESDPFNCGSCGFFCETPVLFGSGNVVPICDRARCGYECRPGFADCNGRPEDGCEADLTKDPHHCGGCGSSCDNAMGQPCVNGACAVTECDAGTVVQ